MGGPAVIDLIARSGLRGRGGGGFPTGRKWAGVAEQSDQPRFVVANGAEGEPGTFKDRAIMRANPYQVVEGLMIAAFAIGTDRAYIGVKASFGREIVGLRRAITEMQGAGIGPEFDIDLVEGPDEYLFGEEKAMLEVIEGRAPLPRLLPPFQHGLFASAAHLGWSSRESPKAGEARTSNPTLVNNIETLANVPHIVVRGPEWYRDLGRGADAGTVTCTVVGDVARAVVAEVPMGTPLREVIGLAGPPPGDRPVKAVLSGVANPVILDLDIALGYETFAAAGSGLGSCGFVVYDDTACMVEVARQFSRFLHVESCGQCPPCKMGSREITIRLERLEAGAADDADVAAIGGWLERVTDSNRCYLAVEEQQVVSSLLRAFPEEFAEHLEHRRCPRPRLLPLPKIVDLVDGVAHYDERQYLKRPDWTYGTASELIADL